MANRLCCTLFGSPKVTLNGEVVLFSFSKINALLYYLLVSKTVSRDEIAGLLWADKSDQNAKKNLRNAIYQTNKALGVEIISSPNKSLLVLNEELDIVIDTDLFLADPQKNIQCYKDEFLKGFFLKDCDSFDFWTVKMRSFYEKKFVQECFKKIKKDMVQNELTDVEKNIHRLIFIDEFDESNYQLLMTFYQTNDRDGKVIETYYNVSNLLKAELGIQPNKQTKAIYEESLERINKQSQKETQRFNSLFFGRYKELQQLETNFRLFKKGEGFHSVVVRGEAGIGKSATTDRVLDSVADEYRLLETQCYQAEEKHAIRPWKKIIDQLSQLIKVEKQIEPRLWNDIMGKIFPNFEDNMPDLKLLEDKEPIKLTILSEVLIEAINKVSEIKQIIFVFEDIQWMDSTSFSLLTSVMLHVNNNVMFMFTARTVEKDSLNQFISSMQQYDKLMSIELSPFTFEETDEFMHKKLPDMAITRDIIDNLYQYTEGNPFFLIEYITLLQSNANLNTMTVKMKDALKNRFLYLTEAEQDVVNITSYFYDYAPLNILTYILNKESLEIVDIMDELVKKNILKDVLVEDELAVSFTHIKLREFVYMNQSIGKKRLIHEKIADYLEKQVLSNQADSMLYSNIAYHYKQGKNELKSLKYKLKYLESYLGYYHELFPVDATDSTMVGDITDFSQEWTFTQFDKVRQKLTALAPHYSDTDLYQSLNLQFLYLEGRYLIKYGEYQQGVEEIRSVIAQSKELNNSDYLLDGYKQMIYYYIQIDEPDKMIYYIELALDLSIKGNNHQSIGILLRLKGLYHMMSGSNFVAEKLLKESINTFMITEDIAKTYAVNIAAAYNYLGEIRINEHEFSEAFDMFEQAIELCSDKKSLSSLSVFHMNAGIALFAQGKYDLAKTYLLTANELYSDIHSFWKRPRLDSYLSLLYVEYRDDETASCYLKSAQDYASKTGSNRDKGIVFAAKALIKKQLEDRCEEGKTEWGGLLEKSATDYVSLALEHLNPYQDQYEITTLNKLFGKN
ncbi:MAG: AAA family ATPase [Vagococcus sp.]